MSDVILKATYETLYMVIGSTFFAVVLGFIRDCFNTHSTDRIKTK